MTTPTTDRCFEEKNKKIFVTQEEAESFEKHNRESFGNQQQYPYQCPHADHFHLASSPSYVVGAPQLRTTDWSSAKPNWQVVEPERPGRNAVILAALKRHNGSKTAKEIGLECGLSENQLTQVYEVARDHDLPFKMLRTYGRMAERPPVTLQSVQSQRLQMEADLKRLDELEKDIIRKEEEKKRVIVKIATNGHKANETMIWATTYEGGGLWLMTEQANSLLAQLPAVIEEMKAREVK
jgi:hypothetical protein